MTPHRQHTAELCGPLQLDIPVESGSVATAGQKTSRLDRIISGRAVMAH
jgi:hypothetical protein